MQLIPPIKISSVVTYSYDLLEQLSEFIKKYNGDKSKEDFLKACNNLDAEKANMLIDQTIKKISRTNNDNDSIQSVLSAFVDRFSSELPELCEEFSNVYSEDDEVKVIDKYYTQMKNIISQNRRD